MRIANGETEKETERPSREVEGWGKEGTGEKGKVLKKADSKQQGEGKRQSQAVHLFLNPKAVHCIPINHSTTKPIQWMVLCIQ